MRPRPIVLALFLSAATSAAAPPPTAQPPQPAAQSQAEPCKPHPARRQASGGADALRRLGDLPPGNLELGVLRAEGNCIIPVIVREGFGAIRKERR